MQCEALRNLPDWPAGTMREVDETTEQIKGLLRGQYIRPVVRPREPRPTPGSVSGEGSIDDNAATRDASPDAPKRAGNAAP